MASATPPGRSREHQHGDIRTECAGFHAGRHLQGQFAAAHEHLQRGGGPRGVGSRPVLVGRRHAGRGLRARSLDVHLGNVRSVLPAAGRHHVLRPLRRLPPAPDTPHLRVSKMAGTDERLARRPVRHAGPLLDDARPRHPRLGAAATRLPCLSAARPRPAARWLVEPALSTRSGCSPKFRPRRRDRGRPLPPLPAANVDGTANSTCRRPVPARRPALGGLGHRGADCRGGPFALVRGLPVPHAGDTGPAGGRRRCAGAQRDLGGHAVHGRVLAQQPSRLPRCGAARAVSESGGSGIPLHPNAAQARPRLERAGGGRAAAAGRDHAAHAPSGSLR